MEEGCKGFLMVLKTFLVEHPIEYVGYIRKCEENLDLLHISLMEVCNKKDEVVKKVKEGEDKLEGITRQAARWLNDVRTLCKNEELRDMMYKDMETAKIVVRMMERRDLKICVREDMLMQEVVVQIMKKFKEEKEHHDANVKEMAEVDYKKVAEVVVELLKDTVEEFKKLLKNDMKLVILATNMLNDSDLDMLTRGDQEMEQIVWDAVNISNEKLWLKDEDAECRGATVGVGNSLVCEAAAKLLSPVRNLVTRLEKWMEDPNFMNVVSEARDVKSGLDVIDKLWIRSLRFPKEIVDSPRQPKSSCCGRYQISKAAEKLANVITDDIICKFPHNLVLPALVSMEKLMYQVLETLKDDQVEAVSVFGMAGIGKTRLAKEVSKRADSTFDANVIVDVSDDPDILRIQATIAESIDLSLLGVDSIAQRAIRIYYMLNTGEKKILVILDNIWNYINLNEIGIPRNCKLLLTTRERDVCRVMGVPDINVFEMLPMDSIEARALLMDQIGYQVKEEGYEIVVDRLLSKYGDLPIAIVSIANALRDKDLATWENLADDLETHISTKPSPHHHDIYSLVDTSYRFIKVTEKRLFFLLACLSPAGSSVSIESLTRYGIGLNLFPFVDTLDEATDVANNWVSELMYSSFLMKGDVEGEIKIHNFVRGFATLLAAPAERHKFMVDVISKSFFPPAIHYQTFVEYTAMSLMFDDENTLLLQITANKLRVLKITGGTIGFKSFNDDFFEEMMNLEVLHLADMKVFGRLPKSLWKLKKLRTLCMEGSDLGNIEQVGELVNLLVLSLRRSDVDELPSEITNLSRLLLLDIRRCISTENPILDNFLYSLSQSGVIIVNNEGTDFQESIANENSGWKSMWDALEIKLQMTEEVLEVKSPSEKSELNVLKTIRPCLERRFR